MPSISRSVAGALSATVGNTPRGVTGWRTPRGHQTESREPGPNPGRRQPERMLRRTQESGLR
eukprot:14492957-Alexandrium_andersonii.AAC.1